LLMASTADCTIYCGLSFSSIAHFYFVAGTENLAGQTFLWFLRYVVIRISTLSAKGYDMSTLN
jgi:hypothetical protein